MTESFDLIDAPQFFDFNRDSAKGFDDSSDGYFDQQHEEINDPLNNSDFFDEVTLRADDFEALSITKQSNFRRSMSIGDLQSIADNIHKLRNGKTYISSPVVQTNNGNFERANHTSSESLNCEAGPSYRRTETMDTINRLAQPKRLYTSEQTLHSPDYIPMAEALRKFQNGTPKRFRTKPKITNEPLKSTIPHTPNLKTIVRSRPTYVLSHEEREQIALDEAKKSQFKAHPLNKKIFQPPVMVETFKGKRSTTVPEPFKLTAAPKKTVSESPQPKIPEFHARPVPKSVYHPQQPIIKAPLKAPLTKAQTPKFMKKYTTTPVTAAQTDNNLVREQPKLKSTKPLPFSFELRDQCMKSKRDALIEKYLEAERKAREFHAKPVPKSVLEPYRKSHSTHSSRGSLQSCGKANSVENMNVTQFKAKPPTVLYRKPFEPKRPTRPLTEVADFILNTDARAKEREHFENQIKEKEERLALLRKEEEMIRQQQEEEELLRARKEAEFKSQGIRKYKEVKAVEGRQITNPVSPKFASYRLKNLSGDKENAV